ncbi:type IV pilus modification protein PilV [Teredinibacter haidensis]|uniref:type IV pilus modification protein PilV n=1 Tax=Teredinibacter haidensis TaxID=2731755 RepID=UPI00094919F1|nr:type IV pilus modification protein PilV [Teredinibacter haidensis]
MNSQRNNGSSLIETLVALIVLGAGLLVVLSMQVKSVSYLKDASLHSQASFLASDIYEGMLTTPSAINAYFIKYADPAPAKPDCIQVSSDCKPIDMASWNVHNWRSNVASLLPGGRGEISSESGQIVIRIEFETGSNVDGSRQTQEYTLITDV